MHGQKVQMRHEDGCLEFVEKEMYDYTTEALLDLAFVQIHVRKKCLDDEMRWMSQQAS